ncbi:replication/maintenance protein RepL, partial [Escherichia coli]
TGTNVVTYKKVDSEEFVKLFSRNIALTFELTSSGIKSLNVLIWSVQNTAIQKDVVALDQLAFDDFMKENPNLKMTLRTFQRGLSELESSKIIAKTMRKGFYYINPNFVFNGDRIAFTTLIERK